MLSELNYIFIDYCFLVNIIICVFIVAVLVAGMIDKIIELTCNILPLKCHIIVNCTIL